MTNKDISKRTIELSVYIQSAAVALDSQEFLPFAAAVEILETTPQTLKHRIENGELEEKSFFFNGQKLKMYRGVAIGGVKRLLLKKQQQKEIISKHVHECAANGTITTYADTMEVANMNWRSPPDSKYCNVILEKLSCESYRKSIDDGRPCLLSAIVVSRNEHIPTESFFACANQLGLLEHDASKQERLAFWQRQKELVFAFYQAP